MPQAAFGRAGEKSRSRTFSATGSRWFESVVRTNRLTVLARMPWAFITFATVLTQQETPRAVNSTARRGLPSRPFISACTSRMWAARASRLVAALLAGRFDQA